MPQGARNEPDLNQHRDHITPTVGSISALRKFLLQHCPTIHGLAVSRYQIDGTIIRARAILPDHTQVWFYYGTVPEVNEKIDSGFYKGDSHG